MRARELSREGLSILLRVLYPVVPHTAWVLWNDLGYAREIGDLLDAPWPRSTTRALAQDEIELVLQVNGKLRGKLVVPARADSAGDRSGGARERRSREARGGRADQEGDRRAGEARQCRGLGERPLRADALSAHRRRRCASALALRLSPARRRRRITSTSIYVNAPGAPAFAAELRRRSKQPAAPSSAEPPTGAGDSRHSDRDRRQGRAVAVAGGGRAREFALQKRVQIRLHDKGATTGCRPTKSSCAARTRSTTPSARAQIQEKRLLKEMQTEAVQQIVRRLQAARKPVTATLRWRSRADDLPRHLARKRSRRSTSIHGDEPLLALEAATRCAPRRARPAATSARRWSSSSTSSGTRSSPPTPAWACSAAASSSTCAFPPASPASKARKALEAYAADPNPDNVTLVTLPRLDRATQKSAWFAALAAPR